LDYQNNQLYQRQPVIPEQTFVKPKSVSPKRSITETDEDFEDEADDDDDDDRPGPGPGPGGPVWTIGGPFQKKGPGRPRKPVVIDRPKRIPGPE
jgi:hypothetical protein